MMRVVMMRVRCVVWHAALLVLPERNKKCALYVVTAAQCSFTSWHHHLHTIRRGGLLRPQRCFKHHCDTQLLPQLAPRPKSVVDPQQPTCLLT